MPGSTTSRRSRESTPSRTSQDFWDCTWYDSVTRIRTILVALLEKKKVEEKLKLDFHATGEPKFPTRFLQIPTHFVERASLLTFRTIEKIETTGDKKTEEHRFSVIRANRQEETQNRSESSCLLNRALNSQLIRSVIDSFVFGYIGFKCCLSIAANRWIIKNSKLLSSRKLG